MFFVCACFRISVCVRVVGCTRLCFARAVGAVVITLRLGFRSFPGRLVRWERRRRGDSREHRTLWRARRTFWMHSYFARAGARRRSSDFAYDASSPARFMDERARAQSAHAPCACQMRAAVLSEVRRDRTRLRNGHFMRTDGVLCAACSQSTHIFSPAQGTPTHVRHAHCTHGWAAASNVPATDVAWGALDERLVAGPIAGRSDGAPGGHGEDGFFFASDRALNEAAGSSLERVTLPPPPSCASNAPYTRIFVPPAPRASPTEDQEPLLLGPGSAPGAYSASPLEALVPPLYTPMPTSGPPTTTAPVLPTSATSARPPAGPPARPRNASKGKTRKIASPVVRAGGTARGPPAARALGHTRPLRDVPATHTIASLFTGPFAGPSAPVPAIGLSGPPASPAIAPDAEGPTVRSLAPFPMSTVPSAPLDAANATADEHATKLEQVCKRVGF